MDIIKSIQDPRIFKDSFDDLKTWKAWETYLKALFGLKMSKEDVKTYKKCTQNKAVPKKAHKTSYVLSGRRSGKSKIAALISVFIATSRDWSKVLSPGEQGYIFLIANDKPQARILKRYVSGILNQSSGLRQFKKKELSWEIELNNRITIAVKTKNFRSIRGYTCVAAILEELAFWRSEESANPDYEILAAIEPSMLTIENSLLVGISSVYAKRGLLYDQFKKYYGKSKGPLIWKSTTLDMNPIADKQKIAEQIRSDPTKYRSEYLSEFRGDIESYLGIEDLERITAKGVKFRNYNPEYSYYGFTDPSGGRRDSMTLGIAHRDNEKAVLDVLLERKPPFSPESVVKEFSETLKRYRISSIQSDRYAGSWVQESFSKNDIHIEYSEFSRSEIYTAFIPIVMNNRTVLLENQKLRTQFSNLERHTRSGGQDVIDHSPGSHDDVANAAAGVIRIISDSFCMQSLVESYGVSEIPESGKDRLRREAIAWLFDRPRKKKRKGEDEVDQEKIETEITQWEQEFEAELRNKDTGKDVVFKCW